MRALTPWLWLGFLLCPADGWGILDGAPTRSLEVSAIAALVWLWLRGVHQPGGIGLPALLIALKVGASFVLVPQGFTARYYANADWAGPHERSPEYPRSAFTRIDRTLQFDMPAGPHLPLFFFNDNTRFNYYQAEQPGRGELPFSIEWRGYYVPVATGDTTFTVRGRGLGATLLIDGEPVLHKAENDEGAQLTLSLPEGPRHVAVRVAAPRGRARAFEVSAGSAGRVQPLGAPLVYSRRISLARMKWDQRLQLLTLAIDVMVLAVLAWLAVAALTAAVATLLVAGRRRIMDSPAVAAILALAVLASLVDALAFARLVDGRLLLLSGGNDMLTYETFGRDIATNGPLMLLGAPRGEALPFYFQPFYPYFLAATHLMFGEDYFGVFFLQRFGVWMSLIVMTSIARGLFGNVAACGAAVSGGVFIVLKLLHWSSVQLSEMLFIPLICLCLQQLVALAKGAGAGTAATAGLLGGLATLTRSSLSVAWLVLIPFLWTIRRRAGFRTRAIHGALLTMIAVISLATVRNWVASGQWVPIATSGPVVLLLGNPPPPGTPEHADKPHAVLRWLDPDDRTVRVIEGALHQPAAFAANLVKKALYTLGFFGAYIPGAAWSPVFVLMWSAALFGLLARRDAFASSVGALAAWLPALMAGAHFAAVTIFVPHVYGDRLVLPFYVLIVPYVGAAIALTVGAARRSSESMRGRYGTTTGSSADGGLAPQ